MSDTPADPQDPHDASNLEDVLSEEISDLDAPTYPQDRVTASEQEQLRSIEDELREELPDRPIRSPAEEEVVGEFDEPDHEGELVGEGFAASDDQLGPEERAMHTTTNPPGATGGATDGYGDDADAG